MNLHKYILIFLVFCSTNVFAEDYFSWSGNLYKNIRKYNIIHKSFSKEVCSPGTDFKYQKLLKKYRGQGNYLPLLKDDIDRKAITKNLHNFSKKIYHIKQIQKKLKKDKKLPIFNLVSKNLNETMESLLILKKDYHSEIDNKKKIKIKNKSKKLILLLKKYYKTFINTVYFLKSYNYPNDHLNNRFRYEKFKRGAKSENISKANEIFFYRKLVEDGAYDKNRRQGDLYTRSTIDSLYHNIVKEKNFISENVRYDLKWVLSVVEKLLKRGYKVQVERAAEWIKRTKASHSFYIDIVKAKNRKKAKKLVKNKNEASIELKKFTYKKQAEVYNFWRKKKRLWKAMFSQETILFNEVGTIDGKDALERHDVAHIVMNRVQDSFYSNLTETQPLVKYLNLKPKEWEKEKWLNTLFKIGEFSFTYHYISSVVKIFCPDMSRRGKQIRNKNLKIALKAMKEPRENYKVFRYFSRVSMLGKIDMASVWSDYVKIPEKPGFEVSRQKKLRRLYYADKYHFLYNFTDPKGISFQVIEINARTYSMTWKRGRPRFFKYRDPHLFTYFSKK
jgi:hypothetical protein